MVDTNIMVKDIMVTATALLMACLEIFRPNRETSCLFWMVAQADAISTAMVGVLCVITEKWGSAPRGMGSMMFVGEDRVLGSVGGGEPECRVIRQARECSTFCLQEYELNRNLVNGLDMICGGGIKVAFIPLK